MTDADGGIHATIVTAKTRVAPIKWVTIPQLELCGAVVLADLMNHGNPCCFKTFVGNRVSHIVDVIPPNRWRHVIGSENPADCASRGLLPSELLTHDLWWNEPSWLSLPTSEWPDFPTLHQSGTWVSFSPTTCLYTQSILKLHTSYSCYCMGNEIRSCMSVDIQSKDNKLHKSNRCRH